MSGTAVTIREVASEAGVSTAAVSKVLHGRGASVRVSEERALHIREVAKQLAYVPNALARSLRSSRTQTIGLLFEHFGRFADGPEYYAELLDGLAATIFPRHYRLALLPEVNHNDIGGSLADGRLDGVIWGKLTPDDETKMLVQNCPIPIVAINAAVPQVQTQTIHVNCDNAHGMSLGLDHLLSLGHTRILFLREEGELNTPDCIYRLAAFRNHLQSRGIDVVDSDSLTWDWNLGQFAEWWQSKPVHTAVFCWSERAGGVFLRRASEHGVLVPDQLSVMGFDSTRYCDFTRPRLTAVSQPIRQMSESAGTLLLDMIEGHRPDQSLTTFPCGLDVRDSTARPRPHS